MPRMPATYDNALEELLANAAERETEARATADAAIARINAEQPSTEQTTVKFTNEGGIMEATASVTYKEAQDLRCGDVFHFRDKVYCCLMTFTDKRHTQTVITALAARPVELPPQTITVIRAFRTVELAVAGVVNIRLETLDMEESEIPGTAITRLHNQRDAQQNGESNAQ